MPKMQVPKNITEAKAELTTLSKLLTAKEWERAAIIAAYVERPGRGARTDRTSSSVKKWSAEQFAALKINGLGSHNTIIKYLEAWAASGHPTPKPGATIELPTIKWPPTRNENRGPKEQERRDALLDAAAAADVGASTVLDMVSNPKALEVALTDDAFRERVEKAIARIEKSEPIIPKEQAESIAAEVKENMQKALGIDPVVSAINKATAMLGEAVYMKAENGVDDVESYAEAMRDHRRMLRMLDHTDETLSDGDKLFLEGLGIAP